MKFQWPCSNIRSEDRRHAGRRECRRSAPGLTGCGISDSVRTRRLPWECSAKIELTMRTEDASGLSSRDLDGRGVRIAAIGGTHDARENSLV